MNAIGPYLLCITIPAATLVGCGPAEITKTSSATSTKSKLLIESRIDLGVIEQGDSSRISQWIRNQSDHEIQIAKIEKSCECLDVKIVSPQIKPGGRSLIHLSYDGAKEPEFVGGLQIEVTLFNDLGECVGKIEVPVEGVQFSLIARLGGLRYLGGFPKRMLNRRTYDVRNGLGWFDCQ